MAFKDSQAAEEQLLSAGPELEAGKPDELRTHVAQKRADLVIYQQQVSQCLQLRLCCIAAAASHELRVSCLMLFEIRFIHTQCQHGRPYRMWHQHDCRVMQVEVAAAAVLAAEQAELEAKAQWNMAKVILRSAAAAAAAAAKIVGVVGLLAAVGGTH